MLYRFAGLLFGFVLAVGACLLIGRRYPARLLTESEGAIRVAEIHFTRASAVTNWPPLHTFLREMYPDVRLVVACGDAADARAFREASQDLLQRDIRIVIVDEPITGWSKDRFLVRGVRKPALVCPVPDASPLPGRAADARVGPTIARDMPMDFTSETAPLSFDAGDLMPVGSLILFNDELVSKNPTVGDLGAQVAKLTGLSPLYLKGSPRHHIGMFAAPLGDDAVAVGDPDLGRRLWTQSDEKTLGPADWSPAAVQPFREAAAALSRAGFRVVRVPTAVIAPKVYSTYTNAVFQVRDGRKIVYMPVYGSAALDGAAEAAYRAEGWMVVPIEVKGVYRLGGTIGCLVNVLARG